MATDYNEIGQNPRINYRKIFTPYSDKTHFVYELIQNADDNESECIEMQLYQKELLVWNDGNEFCEEDVRSICSIGFSNKDLTQIGTFGMGFKAVYTYTDNPEVYSGDELFRISINNPTRPEGVDIDDIDVRVLEQLDKGRTIFRLPFRKELRQEEEIALLKDRLCDLERRALLFLRNLKTVKWYDESSGQRGSYSCHRRPHDKIQDASEVELRSSLNGEDQSSETFLVFRKEIRPPQRVIDELLQQSEDEDERQRIQKSAMKLQPIEVAFKFQDGKITVMDNCVLFSYFPTEKETHLKFLIQASYKTSLTRENIEKDNQWNEWLIEETANYLPEILEQLKKAGLLEPAFFNVVPLEEDNVPGEFSPIAEALRTVMQEAPFVPTQNGVYAKAGTVFYPHRESLRELVESGWLRLNNSWLHPEIRDTEEFRRCFKVMREAGVKEVEVSQVLDLLEKRSFNWFENRCEEWLRSLYVYLNSQKSELERIRKLPLVRLENEEHVCANRKSVFFPPEADEAREEIKPFINDLPILQSALLEGEEGNDIEAFLKSIGVRRLRRVDMILEGILPQYHKTAKSSAEENHLHVRYLFKVWNNVSESEQDRLKQKISEIPILRGYKDIRRKIDTKNQDLVAEFCYVKPCDAYLPQAYTSDDDLETYFSVYDGDIWFVDDAYVEDKSDAKAWLQFLKTIGAMDTPQIVKKNIPAYYRNHQEFDKRNIKREWSNHEQTIEDFDLRGLSEALDEISGSGKINLSQALWGILVKIVPSGKWSRDTFFEGTHSWFHHSSRSKSFEATFYRQLMETSWLPDEQGNFHRPSKCFAPTDDNRKVLGDSVAYLHPDFDVNQDNKTARWLAEKLEIHLNANTDSVINYLQTLSGTETKVEKVEPLYRFLDQQDARRGEAFKQKPLIFTSNPEPRWWRADKVFWKDENPVFDNHRGYLIRDYPETLKPFFTSLGVSEQASQMHYARRIQEIATTEQVEDEKVRERVQRLYKCLQPWREKKWEIIYDSRCWLGRKGDEWGFFTRQELVLKDHPHISELFEGDVPFWAFDGDLSSLARNLKVEGCSQAEVEFHPDGDQEEDTDWSEKVRKLRPYIYAFLNSPRLCEEPDIFMFSGDEELQKEKFAKFSTNCSVRRVKELRVTYEFKGTSVSDPNPRQSSLDVTNEPAKLWLGLKENEDDYAELIGDALQDYFGAKELGRFIEDLLTPTKKQDRVLSNWKRKGLETKFLNEDPKDDESNSGDDDSAADESDMRIPTDNETPKTDDEDNDSLTNKADESEIHLSRNGDGDSRTDGPEIETPTDSKTAEVDKSNDGSTLNESENSTNPVSDIRNISLPDTQVLTNTDSGTTQNANEKSESETPIVHEDPETGNEGSDSTGNESDTSTHRPRPGRGGARWPGGSGSSTPNRSTGTGYGGGGGPGEGEKHRSLKEYLAANPSLFGEGLELIDTEYRFGSGDEADILFEDSSGSPVTVEVKPPISSGSDQEVWQAVKYKHLAAVKYSLPCEQVRSILAAPEIPEDVKEKCKELGIEPIEVSK